MHTGVLLVLESERVTGLKLRLEYISTALNSVPDFLSRGQIEEAKALVARQWGSVIEYQFDFGFVEGSERILCASCVSS